MAVNLIRKNNSDAITAAMDAAMYYMMIGEGIFSGVANSCSASISNGNFTMQSGLISLGGRIVEIPENNPYVFEGLSKYSTDRTIYIKANITIENDDSQSKVAIYASTDSVESTRHALTKADVYTTNLYVITFSTVSGSYLIRQAIASLEPGKAKFASSLLTTGKIGTTNVSELFETSGNSVVKIKQCEKADVADVANGFEYVDNGSGKNVNEVAENLYMPQRGVYLCTDAVLLNNVTISSVKSNFDVEISEDSTAADIPFDSRASLGSIDSYALIKIIYNNGDYEFPAEILQNGRNITGTLEGMKFELMINYITRSVRVRFGKTGSFTMSLHVMGIGAYIDGN